MPSAIFSATSPATGLATQHPWLDVLGVGVALFWIVAIVLMARPRPQDRMKIPMKGWFDLIISTLKGLIIILIGYFGLAGLIRALVGSDSR